MRADVSLLVTTHSPYVISRSAEALLTELRKSPDGATSKAASAPGNESRAELLGSLYRDAGLARVLERSLKIPAGTKVVVITEGYTDGLFVRQCCEAADREDLLDGLHFIPAGKAANVVPQAILAEAATELPVIALLDYDESGQAAVEKLKSFSWEPAKRILSLRSWPGACPHHDIEIEDLLPVRSVTTLIEKLGNDVALDGTEKCAGTWHYRVSKPWKEEAIAFLPSQLTKDDPGGMVWLAQEIWRRAQKIASTKASASTYAAPDAQPKGIKQ
jgi:putative ATP-dependent endonuclease of the OLD family